MGVTCVFPITIPDGKSSHQVFDCIQKKLEFVSAEKVGSWNVDCEAYQSTQTTDGNVKLIYLMHSSEQPQLTFSILENNTCVVSDNGFHLMISKLKLFYTPRKGGKIDVKGTKYALGDFDIKVGNITQASNFKGILMEVEYKPCSVPNQCWSLLNEFVTTVLHINATFPTQPRSLVDQKLNMFCIADTMLQYLPFISSTKKS
ncbi:mediator of RNA polymerase II transcription subunit 20-like [Hydractinia symbiolongicarpus]|uniref:mediator of RNA polymerase II transcription subunit 20-like n=1 Tax=Hydractinia symbiolongicarpus TaxID=13093 RepID=UPI00254C0BF8|nr:mediator of RNA polymerase II transcription subunit 20-like [Hydractinia symbiolongicarpus]